MQSRTVLSSSDQSFLPQGCRQITTIPVGQLTFIPFTETFVRRVRQLKHINYEIQGRLEEQQLDHAAFRAP